MIDIFYQTPLELEDWNGQSPAEEWDQDVARRALDELFSLTRQYKFSKDFQELINFVARFRFYAPFNAMLVHIQLPGAKFVAPPQKWLHVYDRRIKTGARPLVILQPMGPVMFVFDVSDTEPIHEKALPLPSGVDCPFEVRGGRIGAELNLTTENAKRDGVKVLECEGGSQRAGEIKRAQPGKYLDVLVKQRPKVEYAQVKLQYELLLNSSHSAEAKYATMVHELAHLYCGHVGTPNNKWWPDRRGLVHGIEEFEAESVCYLVCTRLGIDNPSDEYLSGYIKTNEEVPPISLECVVKAAGLIEQMGRERLPLRKEK
ncbi:hypothetical protein BAC1_00310 [uncultured bacterium]|nr:hypothetical protein BAC1_00310 [uncultured bacterium]